MTDWKRPLKCLVGGLVLLVGAACWAGLSWGQVPPQTQCISTAEAGGTADKITIPLQPCQPTTSLLLLYLSATNVTATPTLQEIAVPVLPAQTIVTAAGGPLAVGALQAGSVVLLSNDGTDWRLIAGANGGGVNLTATSPIVVTPSPILNTGTVSISPVCRDGSGLALWPNCNQTWGAAQRGNQQGLTISGSTFTPDFNTEQHPLVQLVHASCPCTIAAPSNVASAIGQVGIILVQQSSAGSDLVVWNSIYKWPAGTAPTLTVTPTYFDIFPYYVESATDVLMGTGGMGYAP